jgi:leucyl aminopeptidase
MSGQHHVTPDIARATPSLGRATRFTATVAAAVPADATVLGVPVFTGGTVPDELGVSRDQLAATGFDGAIGQTHAVATVGGPIVVAVGVGAPGTLDATGLRQAAGAFGRAASRHAHLTTTLATVAGVPAGIAAQAVVEGILLARYRFDSLKRSTAAIDITEITVVAADNDGAYLAGAERGTAFANVGQLSRDFANSPPAHLTASMIADVAVALGPDRGLEVEVFDKDALVALGCGGLLGVNAGSAEPPRMVKLTYRPADGAAPTGHLTLVGKGVMYDSGGISLKPGDAVHATMKNDMSGAGAVLATMSGLSAISCPAAVTAYLMCTDNMPSGTAMALGDVITMRGGTTVEVINTDAEGRLILADALVLATEEPTDAIVDIATLTGSCMRALGTDMAGVMGNNQALIDSIAGAAETIDEPVWQLPLYQRYRSEIMSPIADLKNLGGANAGVIHAALFLAEFVGDVPWAHVDIAGPAQNEADDTWHTAGCSGFGARLLLELADNFTSPKR